MLTKEQWEEVDRLVEESKNDKTIIVGSDVRFLAALIYSQNKHIKTLEDKLSKIKELQDILSKVPRTIPAFFHPDQNIAKDVGQDGECD